MLRRIDYVLSRIRINEEIRKKGKMNINMIIRK